MGRTYSRKRRGRAPLAATALAAMLAFTAGPAWGAHAGTIDQVQLSTEAVSLSCFNDFEPAMLAQRVTPAVSSWAQVDLFLRVSPLDGPGTVLTLNVRNDAIDGPIIASSSATRPLESGQPWVSFHFDPAVPLVPGTPVFIQTRLQAQIAGWVVSELDPYDGGSAWSLCIPGLISEHPQSDFAFITYAPAGDADGDGVADALDPDTIGALVEALPDYAISHGHRTALLARLDNIEATIAGGDSATAIAQLGDLRRRLDGCGSSADSNDWIVDCPSQLLVRGMIDDMITALGG